MRKNTTRAEHDAKLEELAKRIDLDCWAYNNFDRDRCKDILLEAFPYSPDNPLD